MKTFKSIFFYIVSVSFAFSLHTCKPDDEYGKTYGPYTLGEARDYLDFKPGSWWVYQNNKSGLYDTLILKKIYIRSQTFTGKNTVIKDMVDMLIYSTTTGYEYKYYSSGANPDAKPEYLKNANFITLIHGKSKPGEYNGETVSFFYPFDITKVSGIGLASAYYIGMDSNLVIKGLEYKNIVKFKQEDDPCWNSYNTKYYWGKDVGLIKKENIEKPESWDLVNYKILK